MYKITVKDEDGNTTVLEKVLDYNVIDLDSVQTIAKEFKTELSDEEVDELEEKILSKDELPDTFSLQGYVEDIILERE